MKCARCGSENATGTLFCDTCGAPQARVKESVTGAGPFQPGQPVQLTPATETERGDPTGGGLSLLALASFLIGIFSVFTMTCLGFIFLVVGPFIGIPPAIAGIALGHTALSRINDSRGELGGSGLAVVGLVLSYLTLFASVLVSLGWVVLGKLLGGLLGQ